MGRGHAFNEYDRDTLVKAFWLLCQEVASNPEGCRPFCSERNYNLVHRLICQENMHNDMANCVGEDYIRRASGG